MAQLEISSKLDYSSTESYKSLRTNLRFCGEDKKVIAITSCTPGEGKSTVSLSLAVSLAEAGSNVLLIAADLRKPASFKNRVKITGQALGLTHYLSKQAELVDVVCNTNVRRLFMMISGPIPPNPSELLGSKRFAQMIKQLRDVYDYIIIDTPPLGSVIDGAIVAEECDGSILVIESGVISYRFAQDVKKHLEKSNSPIIGAVLNKVDFSKQTYGKHYGKY